MTPVLAGIPTEYYLFRSNGHFKYTYLFNEPIFVISTVKPTRSNRFFFNTETQYFGNAKASYFVVRPTPVQRAEVPGTKNTGKQINKPARFRFRKRENEIRNRTRYGSGV